jgi:hypothetical protein
MAKIVETVERDGHQIAIYESGAEYDITDRKLIRGATNTLITKQSSLSMHQRRQEKAAAILRQRIKEATEKVSGNPVPNSSAAVAEAGAMLWEEIVLAAPGTEGVYPRDRLEAFTKIGQISGVIPTVLNRVDTEKTPAIAAGAAFGSELARQFAQIVSDVLSAKQAEQLHDTIDGKVSD